MSINQYAHMTHVVVCEKEIHDKLEALLDTNNLLVASCSR